MTTSAKCQNAPSVKTYHLGWAELNVLTTGGVVTLQDAGIQITALPSAIPRIQRSIKDPKPST